jgi:CubicO group peptidase (beta-lactamase class C family)/murein DD-endopeptidase MepM/ murein hydrolase activator NlpD
MSNQKKNILQVVIVCSIILLVLYGIAFLSTSRSQLARAIIWLESDVEDYKRFPSRTINNTPPIYYFKQIPGDSPYSSIFETISYQQDDQEISADFEYFLESTDTTAFLVIKDEVLLYQGYANGYNANSIQTSFSVSKSFVSALVGIAIDEGYIDSIDDPIKKYIPELINRDQRFNQITIKHLLTMSSGIQYKEAFSPWSDNAITYYAPDLRAAALSCAIVTAPGKEFLYNNYNPLLLGLILERTTGQSVSQYLEDKIWEPLGMESPASWSLDSEVSGFELMGSGSNARAIDFAKFGLLFLNKGNWHGQKIISSDWIEESTRADTITDPALFYQYLWWVTAWETDPGDVHYRYVAVGKYGQYIHIFPEQELIFLRFGKSEGGVNWGLVFEDLAARIASVESTPSNKDTHPISQATPVPTNTVSPSITPTQITFPTPTTSACMARATFGDPTQSAYVLPYPVGDAYLITQSYCYPWGSHANQLAYDFGMPIGVDVIAARAGVVIATRDDTPDEGTALYINQHNYIFIRHEDGTVAFYAHLKQNSITVKVGQYVESGQKIAASGNSGATGGRPHLHFGVYQWYPPEEGFDVPVNFRNADGRLDSNGGLISGVTYKALPH